MNSDTYIESARAFAAFNVFVVMAFTVAQLGLSRVVPYAFVRQLARVWAVYVVLDFQRIAYLLLPERTSGLGTVLFGIFGANCALLVLFLWRAIRTTDTATDATILASSTETTDTRGTGGISTWSLAVLAGLAGMLTHFALTGQSAATYEIGIAAASRAFRFGALAAMYIIALRASRQKPFLLAFVWGFTAQGLVLIVDTVVRAQSFDHPLSRGEALLSSAAPLGAAMAVGIASLLSSLDYARQMVTEQATRLRLAQERAAESIRWQQVGQLARGVAHDFNNVLGVIVSGSDLVGEGIVRRDPETDGDIQEIEHAVARGRSLTQRLLRFARHQRQTPMPVDVGAVARDLAPMLQRLIGPDLTLALLLAPKSTVCMDPTALEQILLNLVVNARDASPPQGCIHLRTEVVTLGVTAPAAVGTLRPASYVCIAVEDEGDGISPDVLPRLWEPFFTTKGARGTGIGLPTVAAAVTEVGGAIDVESVLGQGSRFRVWIPISGLVPDPDANQRAGVPALHASLMARPI